MKENKQTYCDICDEYHYYEKTNSHENAAMKAKNKFGVSI